MSTNITPADNDAWSELVRRHVAFIDARMGLLRMGNALELIRAGLRGPHGLVTALVMIPYLPEEARKSLLPDLVRLASYAHAQVGEVYARIAELPRGWVLDNIDPLVERRLEGASYEEYRALLELYDRLGAHDRVERLARRAAASDDADIREAGEDHLQAPTGPDAGG